MSNIIKITVDILSDEGIVIQQEIAYTKSFDKPTAIEDFGFRHQEQIEILQSVQDSLISQQIKIINQQPVYCEKCGVKMAKKGYIKSDFNAVFTDHKVSCSRKDCPKCKHREIPSVKSISGTHIHPDLAKLQLEASSNHTYSS